ncbi:MAG: hypothetical protein JEZ14_05265 [Marinilabiliaceae bacterium]|nr:hypothetical protein [Marinilabiliaceae bacterium]
MMMLKEVLLNAFPLANNSLDLVVLKKQNQTVINLSISDGKIKKYEHLSLDIEFEYSIVKWRNFDYKWVDTSRRRIANYYSPKCLVLDNGFKVVGGSTIGVWEFNSKFPTKLKWIIHDAFLTPLVKYDRNNQVIWFASLFDLPQFLSLKLLYTQKSFPEFSRSPVPFSAILTFTDHCDFDTDVTLEKQRELFRKYNIPVTKGFFLYHYSKRKNNVSWERQKDLLTKWLTDGHELCHHSLTQSIRSSKDKALDELKMIIHEGLNCVTWIDHGYQPYNFTKLNGDVAEKDKWAGILKQAGIKNLWNYLDTGTSGRGLINQLDYEAFQFKNYLRNALHLKGKRGLQFFIRSYYLYFASASSKKVYFDFVKTVKRKEFRNGLRSFAVFFRVSILFLLSLLNLLNWRSKRNRVTQWGKYAPVFFKANVQGKRFNVFQTLEVHDFNQTFSPQNIKHFIEGHGVCLAHTYFSVLDKHLDGRIFKNCDGEFMPGIIKVFERLHQQVMDEKLWIGQLKDVADYFDQFEQIYFDIDDDGNINHHVKNADSQIYFKYTD